MKHLRAHGCCSDLIVFARNIVFVGAFCKLASGSRNMFIGSTVPSLIFFGAKGAYNFVLLFAKPLTAKMCPLQKMMCHVPMESIDEKQLFLNKIP